MSTLIIDILLIYNSDKNRARSEIYFAKLSFSDAFLKRYSKKLYNKASETHNNNKKYKQMLAFYHFALEVKIRNGLLICRVIKVKHLFLQLCLKQDIFMSQQHER